MRCQDSPRRLAWWRYLSRCVSPLSCSSRPVSGAGHGERLAAAMGEVCCHPDDRPMRLAAVVRFGSDSRRWKGRYNSLPPRSRPSRWPAPAPASDAPHRMGILRPSRWLSAPTAARLRFRRQMAPSLFTSRSLRLAGYNTHRLATATVHGRRSMADRRDAPNGLSPGKETIGRECGSRR